VDICHNGETLNLPLHAAITHLEQHPGDTWGACPVRQPAEAAAETEEEAAVTTAGAATTVDPAAEEVAAS